MFGPFAGLATALASLDAVLLYTDVIVSAGAAGVLYSGASTRLSFALACTGYVPGPFAGSRRGGRRSSRIAFSFLCGLAILLPFPGWRQFVGFICAAAVVAYAMVPLSLGALRRQDPECPPPFRLSAARLAPTAVVVASKVLLFTGWTVVWNLLVAIVTGFALVAVSALTDPKERALSLDSSSAVWLWPYLFSMGAISYLGSFDTGTRSSIPLLGLHGPRTEPTFGWDDLGVALFSLAVLRGRDPESAAGGAGAREHRRPDSRDAHAPTPRVVVNGEIVARGGRSGSRPGARSAGRLAVPW